MNDADKASGEKEAFAFYVRMEQWQDRPAPSSSRSASAEEAIHAAAYQQPCASNSLTGHLVICA